MIDDVADCLQGIFNDHKCGKLFISVADTICKIDFKYQHNKPVTIQKGKIATLYLNKTTLDYIGLRDEVGSGGQGMGLQGPKGSRGGPVGSQGVKGRVYRISGGQQRGLMDLLMN